MTYNGSGHKYFNSGFFVGDLVGIKLGFIKAICHLSARCVDPDEVCIFKVSNATLDTVESSHIADCNTPDFPFTNTFNARLCCQLREFCDDGKDNDGDTYIDCGDEDCKQIATNTPKECTGSNLTSPACVLSVNPVTNEVNYNPDCDAEDPLYDYTLPRYAYCSFGASEFYTPGSTGICCQVGYHAEQDPDSGEWGCIESDPCGPDSPPFPCDYDFDNEKQDWLDAYFRGDIDDWCVNRLPFLYLPYSGGSSRSTGCCLTQVNAVVGYYFAEDNVKIFGYTKVCGDEFIDYDEECDGGNLGGATCYQYFVETGQTCDGAIVGSPVCTTDTCNLVFSECSCAPYTYCPGEPGGVCPPGEGGIGVPDD
jgi:hypothetical protein